MARTEYLFHAHDEDPSCPEVADWVEIVVYDPPITVACDDVDGYVTVHECAQTGRLIRLVWGQMIPLLLRPQDWREVGFNGRVVLATDRVVCAHV